MTRESSAIEVACLTKRFRLPKGLFGSREIVALDAVSFSVPRQTALGIIGPNGSGKSTLLRILSTSLLPSSGQAWVGGVPISQVHRVKPLIGVISSEAKGFYDRLSGRENLEFFATLQRLPRQVTARRLEGFLGILGLAPLNGQPIWTYSTGQRQRLNIARALLHDPPILLFDEPTKSLDFWAAHSLREWIRKELVEHRGKTLLIASNQIEDIRELCRYAIHLRKGQLIWQGSVSQDLDHSLFEETTVIP